eukprot:Em0778g1a
MLGWVAQSVVHANPVCVVALKSLRLNKGSKKAFSLQSLVGSPEIIENPVNMDAQVLATIPTTIRDILKAEKKQLKSNNAGGFFKDHAARVIFQAKIDKLYLSHGFIAKQEDAMPGGKQQEARAGVDYIKVNFHIDNFTIVDKLIDVLAPPSDVDHTLRDELRGLRTDVYTFLSYGYALHAREGVKASEDTQKIKVTTPINLKNMKKPNKNPKAGDHLDCNACRSPFLFFDKLRHVALIKLIGTLPSCLK